MMRDSDNLLPRARERRGGGALSVLTLVLSVVTPSMSAGEAEWLPVLLEQARAQVKAAPERLFGVPSANHTLGDCITDPDCHRVLKVGHRGSLLWAPENTLTALERARLMGADAVEIDLRATRDGVLVLMHDSDLSRTTDCSGRVEQQDWKEMAQCTVFPLLPGFPTDRIPTFRQVLDASRGLTVIDVDVKVGTPELGARVVEQVVALGMTEQVMLLTRNVEQALLYNSVAPGQIALLGRVDDLDELDGFLSIRDRVRLVALETDIELLPVARKPIREAGLRAFVDSIGVCDVVGPRCYALLLRWEADLIQTDRLALLGLYLQRVDPH
jgi:glycerophosphoryl diester phosphodiesterase